MSKHIQVQAPAPRVVHYVDPAPARTAEILLYSAAQLAQRRREEHLLYTRWVARQARYAEHDRKVRRFWLGFGSVVGGCLVAAVGAGGWLLYHAVTHTPLGLLAVPLLVLAGLGVAVGGHRCITVVQHWH
jgi:hypothetical protein